MIMANLQSYLRCRGGAGPACSSISQCYQTCKQERLRVRCGEEPQRVCHVCYALAPSDQCWEVTEFPFYSLQERQRTEWGSDNVQLVFGDMRMLAVPEKVDILVSELLGSFGDNELSPECLDGAMRFLKREC